ncbi:MAG: NFACT family protein, partial [Candidatus Aenigmarchaeota archaeon]|nr:NFACT family protein [Candidatus Aenigmarchaeota archaeon]
DYKILMPLQKETWKTRKIIPKEEYYYPPPVKNPFKLTREQFENLKSEKEVVKFLATDLSLSGLYAEEICKRANIDKNKKFNDIKEKSKLYIALKSLMKIPNPKIIIENEKLIDVVPIDMKIYKNMEYKDFSTFNEALDEFFSKISEKTHVKKTKVEKIIEKQEKNIKNLEQKMIKFKEAANYIYNNFEKIEKIIQQIKNKTIPENIKIDKNRGIFFINNIEIDFKKSAQQNAQKYFEEFKKYKRKFENAIKKSKQVIDKLKIEEKQKNQEKIIKKRQKGEWYEKFHWFYTTDNFLVIAGKNAMQNDIIFKKYLDKNDIVLHADIVGASLTVIKSQNKEIPLSTIKQAAQFAAVYSSAWKKGAGSIDVYWIKPEQVSKTPEAGEYISKGSFIIRGKKNYLKRVELKIAIGYDGTRIIGGPPESIKSKTKKYVILKPGYLKQGEIAKKIKNKKFKEVSIDEIQKFIPPGKSQII